MIHINNLYMRITSVLDRSDVLLDIGCGDKLYTKKLKGHCEIITLDAWEKTEPDIVLDISKEPLPFSDDSIDVVLMLDLIEHLERNEGKRLLTEAERACRKCLIILTPLLWDDNHQHTEDPDLWCFGNQFNLHKSLWTENDFIDWERWEVGDPDAFAGIKLLNGLTYTEQLLKKL